MKIRYNSTGAGVVTCHERCLLIWDWCFDFCEPWEASSFLLPRSNHIRRGKPEAGYEGFYSIINIRTVLIL